ERTARAIARVVDYDIRRAELALHGGKQLLDVCALRGIARQCLRTGLLREPRELAGGPRRERDVHSILAEQPRQRGAEPASGADDESGAIIRHDGCFLGSPSGTWNPTAQTARSPANP